MLNQSKLPFNAKTDLRKTLRVDEILLAVAIGLLLVAIVGYAQAETHFEDDFEAYADDVKMDSAGDEYTSSCGSSRWWSWNDTTYTGNRSLSGTTWRSGCNDLTVEFDTGKTNASTKFYIFFKDTSGVGQNFIFYDFPKSKGCVVNVEDTEITKNVWHEGIVTTWLDGEDFWCSLTIGEFYEESQGTAGMASTTWLYLSIDANCGQNEWTVMDDFQQAVEMPVVNIEHKGVITAYPNLAIIGTTGITAIRNEGHFSIKNSYYITIREGETGGLDYLAGQDLVLATSTYVLYEHTGTTSIQIATSTTVQNATATVETLYVCSPGIACYDYTVTETVSTFFDVADLDNGKMYYIVPTLEFNNMEFIGETELVIEDSTPPTWTRHWILKGDYNILTEDWEFNTPTEQYIHTGGEPADYTGGVATTTGEIIIDWGTFGEFVSKYLSFLTFQQGTTFFKILDVMFNPRVFLLNVLEQFNLKTKIPFSYIYEIRTLIETELENLGTYNASTTAGTMYFDIGTNVWEINIVDIAQAKSDYESEFINLRTIIHYSLWLGFVFYLVRKLQVVSKGI